MKEKTKILLSTIPTDDLYSSLALLYLKTSVLTEAYLQERVEIEIKEFSRKDTDISILWQMQKDKPEIIGFSCYIWNIERVLDISLKLKMIDENLKIILGGPGVSSLAEAVLKKNKQIDFIVRGEGEITFKELLKTLLDSKNNLANVSGLTYRDNGKIISNGDREVIADLDSIPSPYLSNLNHLDLENRCVCLETQRGCMFKCDYCYYHKTFEQVRFFSIERVKKDLAFLLQEKIMVVYLMDPVLNLDMDRAKKICRFIIKNNKNNIPFHIEIRAELIDDELAGLFHKANVTYLEVGLQTTNENVLEAVHRKLDFKKFKAGIELLKHYHLNISVHLIFGLPQDTFFSFMKSLEQVLDLVEPKNLNIFTLVVLPGTEIWKNAKKWGLVYEEGPYRYILKSNSISFSDIVQIEKIKYSLILFEEFRIIKCLSKDINVKLLELIKLWLEWLKEDKFLLDFARHHEVLKEKLKSFLLYLIWKNKDKINLDFYDALLKKELGSSNLAKGGLVNVQR